MGLNNFLNFIRNKHPALLKQEHVSFFAHQYCFIDIASYLYQYICIMGTQNKNWLNACLKLVASFKMNCLVPVVVFDGKSPDAKQGELQERKQARDKQMQRVDRINTLLSELDNHVTISEEDTEFLKREYARSKHVILGMNEETQQATFVTDIEQQQLKLHVQTLNKAIFSLSSEDRNLLKQILSLAGIRVMQAPHEAESLCCWLCKTYGGCVVSCDTDCLAYRCPHVILKYEVATGFIQFMSYEDVHEAFQFEHESQMVDYAILIGCDYNKGVRVNKIGQVYGLKFIQEYKCLENIPNLQLKSLNIDVCRHMFYTNYEKDDFQLIAQTPNSDQCLQLAQQHRINAVWCKQLMYGRTTEIALETQE